jgi:Tat protein translocase TatB subunit
MLNSPIILFIDISGGEFLLILLVILVVVGPDKIPEFARKTGQVIRYVRKATDDIKREIEKESDAVQKPFKSAYENVTSLTNETTNQLRNSLNTTENPVTPPNPVSKSPTLTKLMEDSADSAKQQ